VSDDQHYDVIVIGTGAGGGTVAHFVCRTTQRVDAGDHVVIFGEIESYRADGGEPLVAAQPTALIIKVTHGDETDRARAAFGPRPGNGT